MRRNKMCLFYLMIICLFVICFFLWWCNNKLTSSPIDNDININEDEMNDEDFNNESFATKYNDIVITTDVLNFREEPSLEANVIKTFYKNEELQVIDRTSDDGWLLVKNNGVFGYVSSEYTFSIYNKLKEAYPNTMIKSIEVKKVVYATDNLNIRSMPGTEYSVLETIPRYVSVRVLEEFDDWYFVMTNEYLFGYVSKEYTKELTGNYVIVDKSVQRLFLYNDTTLQISTVVTTGKDSTPSDTGLFKIYSKSTNRYLIGSNYKAWVNYWMPYNRGEGLHDASWHNIFGSDKYHTSGSHGCINMPPAIAGSVYNNVSVGTTVLVHQ